MLLKEIFYDWGGFNSWLFIRLNAIQGEYYDASMLALSHMAEYHNFPSYLAALLVIALVSLLMRSVQKKGGTKAHVALWFGVFVVLAAGFVAESLAMNELKHYFAYPRPYVALESQDIRVMEYNKVIPGDDHRSFPSGHTAFATLMVAALWPVIPAGMGWIGMLLVAGVGLSRIALGMHFPADVVGAVVIMTPLIVVIRFFIYWALARLFGLRC